MMNVLARPPKKLNAPAVIPLVAKAKNPFTADMKIALGSPSVPQANIVTVFERPSFAPGGRTGMGGSKVSSKERIRARALKSPVVATF